MHCLRECADNHLRFEEARRGGGAERWYAVTKLLRAIFQYRAMHRRITAQRRELAVLNEIVWMWQEIARDETQKRIEAQKGTV